MKLVTVCGPKGTGKTAISVNLASTLATTINPLTMEPYKVLLIDMNPNCGATEALGFRQISMDGTERLDVHNSSVMLFQPRCHFLSDIVYGSDNDQPIEEIPYLQFIPAHSDLYEVEKKLNEKKNIKEAKGYLEGNVLLNVLVNNLKYLELYDTIFIDIGSSITQIALNALVAADSIVYVTDPSMECLDMTQKLIERSLADIGRVTTMNGLMTRIILNQYHKKRITDELVLDLFSGYATDDKYQELVSKFTGDVVPQSIYVAESLNKAVPLCCNHDPHATEIKNIFRKTVEMMIKDGFLIEKKEKKSGV